MRDAKQTDALTEYAKRRDFDQTAEPRAVAGKRRKKLGFVIQKHWASRLHYDFRLELDGVLLSWALPKALSYDPKQKRIAIQVEDHPVDYATFEGTIPAKQYGAGTVIVWDRGTWEPIGNPQEGMVNGKLLFALHGEKLAGQWELVRISKPGEKNQKSWMLFKKKDEWAQPLDEYDVISALPDSVVAKPLGLVEAREPRQPLNAVVPKLAPAGPVRGAKGVKRPLPLTLEPQLATLANTVPSAGQWVYEVKFDGYRMMARIERGKAQLLTRGGHDWTSKMPAIAEEVEALGIKSGWLDGEVVAMNDAGIPDFNALQKSFDRRSTSALSYFIFDAPFLDGYDLRQLAFLSRKSALQNAMANGSGKLVRYTEHFEGDPKSVLASACEMKLEGVIAKRVDALYVSERSPAWLKLKCTERQEFVIAGFTNRQGAAGEVGGLLLGYYADDVLTYAGSVGTGWTSVDSSALFKILRKIETKTPPLDIRAVKPGRWSKREAGTERWVTPTMVCEVAFAEWTPDGRVRHPSFKGLRADKPARSVVRELPGAGGGEVARAVKSIKVTNPERIIDPSTGLTKADLVRYYESIAERLLPHLADRPVSLVRAPAGIAGQQFFQKHDDKLSIPGMRAFDAALWPGHAALLNAGSVSAIVNAAQMNVVEFHTWNSTAAHIDHPDRVIFDLDPGEGVSWEHVKESAMLVQAMLSELGLQAWLKTSGGKGLHVVVPLEPITHSDVVKAFSQTVVRHLAKTIPSRFVSKSGPSNRIGKIFIDWLRNGQTQTTAAAFSARARPGLGVSMPMHWEALGELRRADYWTIKTAREHLSFERDDPWKSYWSSGQVLQGALSRLS